MPEKLRKGIVYLDDTTKARYCARVAQGWGLITSAGLVAVSYSSTLRARHRDPSFADEVEAALLVAASRRAGV
jgi:hypothetical protein